MKKIVLAFSAIYFLMFISVYSCKKPACPPPEEPSQFDYLTEDYWKVDKFEEYINGNLTRLNPGDPDERFVFSPSKDYFYFGYDGSLEDYGTFQFNSGDPSIIDLYLVNNRFYRLTVDKLTADTLQYETSFTRNGQSYRWVYYLKR